MLRRFVVRLAKRLPSKGTADRVLPWITATLGLAVAISGLYQFAQKNRAERVDRVMDLHQRYIAESKSLKQLLRDSSDQLLAVGLTTRCRFIKEYAVSGRLKSITSVAVGELSKLEDLRCETESDAEKVADVDLTEEGRALLRSRITKDFLVATNLYDRAAPEKVLDFLNAVVTCVDAGACDEKSAVMIFGADVLDLINNFCDRFEADADRWGGSASDEKLARFLLRNGIREQILASAQNHDKGRKKVFRCEHLRSIETEYQK